MVHISSAYDAVAGKPTRSFTSKSPWLPVAHGCDFVISGKFTSKSCLYHQLQL
jgi:hypothetical protein